VSVKADTGVSVVQGALSILAGQGISLGLGSVVSAVGSVDLQAAAGALVMNASARIASGGGNIRLAAGTDIVLGTVDARLADGTVNANGSRLGVLAGGSIASAWLLPAATDANLRGADALLQAGTGIGSDLGALRLDVSRVSAHTAAGDIHLYALGNLEIGAVADLRIERVVETGRTAALWTLEQSGLRAGGRVAVTAVGSIDLLTDPALEKATQSRPAGLLSLEPESAGATAGGHWQEEAGLLRPHASSLITEINESTLLLLLRLFWPYPRHELMRSSLWLIHDGPLVRQGLY
jgi:hypothetical protein